MKKAKKTAKPDVFAKMEAQHKEDMKLLRMMVDAAPDEKTRKKIIEDDISKTLRKMNARSTRTMKRMQKMREQWKERDAEKK